MKTKRDAGKPADRVAPQNKPPAPSPPVAVADEENSPRVALVYYRDEQGNADFARMQPRVKENFRKFFENADNRKAIGLVAAPETTGTGKKEELFGADEVTVMYDALGFIDAVIGCKLYGVPFEMAQEAFTFTDFQRQKLSAPTVRVLNKWAPKILAQWKDEIGLGI